jgi:hypothetical protein
MSGENVSQWAIPFSNRKEAKIYANRVRIYWQKRTTFKVKVTVQNLMPIRTKVGKDWRKSGWTT